jgi:hypothetical protein
VNDTAAEASVHGAEGGTDEFRSRQEVIPFDSSAGTRRRVSMSELIADLFISVDGCAKGSRSPAYFGFGGPISTAGSAIR